MDASKSTLVTKIVISILAWAACVPALFIYGAFAITSVIEIGNSIFSGTSTSEVSLFGPSAIFGILAWLLLAVMNIAWIKQHQLGDPIPLIGMLCAAIAILPFGLLAVVALPGMVFAAYLVFWHVR